MNRLPSYRLASILFLLPTLVAGCARAGAEARSGSAAGRDIAALRTRAERTDGLETTRYDEVVAFARAAAEASPRLHYTTFGYTVEGRRLPLVVFGDVEDASPESVRAAARTRVLIQADIHAGEVEGKEAALVLLRELATGEHAAWADSLVLLVVPIYNADGNERISLYNRPLQLGPFGGMGQRTNARGLDLNRDHTKLESPEAHALVELYRDYDPQVVVDLHTTDGTHHGYHLTYALPMHPNTDPAITDFLRRTWLPAVTDRLEEEGLHTFYYGNIPGGDFTPEGIERGWYTFDYRARFNNNYVGIRNRFGILSEAYAYLPFPERISATLRFVTAVVDFAAGNASGIRRRTEAADARPLVGTRMALTAELAPATDSATILMGEVARERNPYTGEPVLRRLDVVHPERMPLFQTFRPVATERLPSAYLVPPELGALVDKLRAHGIRLRALTAAVTASVERFRITASSQAERSFQGHRARTVQGSWAPAEAEIPAGTLVVPADQPLGRLAFILLEPRSDDGFLAWDLLPSAPVVGGTYPILRSGSPLP